MKKISRLHYLSTGALVTVIMLLIYACVQQGYRTGLNDPQIQMTRDIASKINLRRSFESLIAADSINIDNSLSPFVVLYNDNGKAIQSNALLAGKMPQIPAGLFDVARKNGEHTVTWQPRDGIRMAMVIKKTNGAPMQFIAAGRSMKEVEARIKQMQAMVFLAWMACMAIIIITAVLNHFMSYKNILQKTR